MEKEVKLGLGVVRIDPEDPNVMCRFQQVAMEMGDLWEVAVGCGQPTLPRDVPNPSVGWHDHMPPQGSEEFAVGCGQPTLPRDVPNPSVGWHDHMPPQGSEMESRGGVWSHHPTEGAEGETTTPPALRATSPDKGRLGAEEPLVVLWRMDQKLKERLGWALGCDMEVVSGGKSLFAMVDGKSILELVMEQLGDILVQGAKDWAKHYAAV